jgi:hypothetical protein
MAPSDSKTTMPATLTQYDENDVELDNDDLEYLLSKMGQLPQDKVVVHYPPFALMILLCFGVPEFAPDSVVLAEAAQ